MPLSSIVTPARPSAPVVAPPTLASASGAPFAPSVTLTVNGCPVVADDGPASRRAWAFEKPSKAHRTSSPVRTGCWQPPTLENSEFTSSAQNCDDVWLSEPMRLIR